MKNFFKKLIILFSLFLTMPSFASSETDFETEIRFNESIPIFEKLGVDLEDLSRYILDIQQALITNNNILVNDDDYLFFEISVQGIKNNKSVCQQDYKKCVLVILNLHLSDNVDVNKAKVLIKSLDKIEEVKVINNNIDDIAIFNLKVKKTYMCKFIEE